MANQTRKIIPIRRGTSLTDHEREAVELAFAHWLGRLGERSGSPIDDFLRAWQEVRTRTAGSRKRRAGLLVMISHPTHLPRRAMPPPSAGA